MAEIADGGGGDGKGKKRAKKGSTRVDMTPMVDLAFLLLTFFVLTSTFQKPKVMNLAYPAKEKIDNPNPPIINNAITFLLSKGRIFYYKGEFYPAGNAKGKPATTLEETNLGPDGVRKMLRDGNKGVIRAIFDIDQRFARKEFADSTRLRLIKEAKKDQKKNNPLSVLVKTDEKALTREFIDIIDELYIANIGMIAPVDLMKDEQKLIDEKLK
ncbi:MAG: biopolymer transporter ExbD [Fluviicola sp.]